LKKLPTSEQSITAIKEHVSRTQKIFGSRNVAIEAVSWSLAVRDPKPQPQASTPIQSCQQPQGLRIITNNILMRNNAPSADTSDTSILHSGPQHFQPPIPSKEKATYQMARRGTGQHSSEILY
jgi:hypothetical protein